MAEKDIMEKSLESFNDVFADIVNVLLFDGVERVREDELEQAAPVSYYKAEGKLREQERDTAKYWKQADLRISMLGMENESEPENDIPLRIIGYDGAAYRDQLYDETGQDGKRRRNRNPRYPVVTMVLYFGSKHWKKPVTLHECVSIPEGLSPYVSDYRVNLFEIAWLTDEQVSKFKSDFRIVADYFVQLRKNGDYIPSPQQMTHVREVLHMMSVLTKDDRFESVQALTQEGAEPKTMCEVLDRYINKGMEKGIADALRSLMETMGWNIDQAMTALKVPAAEREKYARMIEQ